MCASMDLARPSREARARVKAALAEWERQPTAENYAKLRLAIAEWEKALSVWKEFSNAIRH
jgi:hypothetical protein